VRVLALFPFYLLYPPARLIKVLIKGGLACWSRACKLL